MYKKILIADRGEIALRIIRTCKRLGIATMAVYSDADRQSLYWQAADESVYIRGTHDRESSPYLEKIISAAVSANCQAVHPGHGVLSENAGFARSLEAAGLSFIGPPADVIALMGDRIAAKELAVKARVPVMPGHVEALKDEAEALSVAESIGYPVLLKHVAAGGRGKGMRMVKSPVEMAAALKACCRETRKVFGDNRIFMERYIEESLHVEIQILADKNGNFIHLGERDASIRHRFRKIIEESPSSGVSWELRQRMGKAACTLARMIGYVNAGTVDFLLDAQGGFYFLGMDTGLRAGYVLTEMLTGLDLVELQLRIAFGEPLPLDQAGVVFDGWAMAAHIWDSLPQMVSFHGKSRELTRMGLIESLNNYPVTGPAANINFISSVLGHPDFVKGSLTTDFVDRRFKGDPPSCT